MKQIKAFIIIVTYSFILSSCALLLKPVIGSIDDNPMEAKKKLSPKAKNLIDEAFQGTNKCLVDVHVHAVGNGSHGTRNWVNPKMQSIFHPYKNIQFNVYLKASGIKNEDNADKEYIERLISFLKAEPRYGKVVLLAFDYFYNENGVVNKDHSTFHIDNEYVYNLSKKYPQYFIPAISIHPARKDAVVKLEKWAQKGVKFIKWLPNAQGIEPNLKKYIPYYSVVKKYDMVIISHTGHEKAVEGDQYQKFGDPWHFKLPLSMGVKVIMSHVASLGDCHLKGGNDEKMQSCFKSFTEVFNDKSYKNNLYGEMSGINIYTRVGKPMSYLLQHPEMKNRLINGSDYPLPAINILYRTGQHRKLGYITEEEEELLNEIYHYNPLVFDFVLKRTMRDPKTKQKLPVESFLLPKELCSKI